MNIFILVQQRAGVYHCFGAHASRTDAIMSARELDKLVNNNLPLVFVDNEWENERKDDCWIIARLPLKAFNEYVHLNNTLSLFQEISKRENKRHEMEQHLTFSMLALLEDELIPLLENELDVDYEPDETGEPPMTADEIHTAAWRQHQELHS